MKRRLVKIALLAPLIAFAGILAWFFAVRALSPLYALDIRQNPAAPPPRPFNGTLRTATYNICHGRGNDANVWPIRDKPALHKRLKGIADFLKAESPDLAVLEEVDFDSMFTGRRNQAEYIAKEAAFPCWIEQRDIDVDAPFLYTERFGNVVLSRLPVKDARLINLPAYATWEVIMAGCARAVLCEVEPAPNLRVRFLGTHLESRSEKTRVESAQIIEKIRKSSPLPFIVAGDLNSTPKGFPCSQQLNGMNALSLLLDSGGYTTLPLRNPTPEDSTGSGPIEVIDWILVPPSWRILSERAVPLPWSDHRAVVMEVQPG
jgi:endonuclease/exonuclease/phosphatase family metal-dependent hydrolase